MPKTPSYRCRSGYTQAIVTLTDALTKKRRDYWLGEHGTPESREQYHRLVAEWEANERRLPRPPDPQPPDDQSDEMTLVVLLRDFHRHAKKHYDAGEYRSFVTAMRLMTKLFGLTPASEFGPKKLRTLRDEMVRGDTDESPPRRPWSRRYVNQQVQRIRRIFKWGVAHEFVPASVHQALCTMEPLKRGRSTARENPKVAPAPPQMVEAVLPHLSKPVRALVELQLLTGARAGELLGLRACDLEIDDKAGVWSYRPYRHKNTHREHERVIYVGPKAQEVLRPFIKNRATTECLFSPAEADAECRAAKSACRKTPLSCGNRPGTNIHALPQKTPGTQYTTDSFRRSIWYACDRVFPPPKPLVRDENETKEAWRMRLKQRELLGELNAWRRQHRFHPHQLRHSAGTIIRHEFGLEAAQLALGHASAVVTDAVYADRDHTKVIEIMRKIG